MKTRMKFAVVAFIAFLTAGCGTKALVDTFTPMDEPKALIELSKLLPEKDVSLLEVEWTPTTPKAQAPNSLTYDNYSFSLTYKTPSETIVYGPVQREVIKKLAEKAKSGEAVKISDVTKNGAKIISRKKKTAAKT